MIIIIIKKKITNTFNLTKRNKKQTLLSTLLSPDLRALTWVKEQLHTFTATLSKCDYKVGHYTCQNRYTAKGQGLLQY